MPTLEAQLAALITSLGADFKTLAPKASPQFTGHPKGVTEAVGDNSTNLASTAYVDTASGLLVPKSTVTTKGDLIVASGAGAVARLGVSGTDGRVLTEDAASANGVKWAAASGGSTSGLTDLVPWISGNLYGCPYGTNSGTVAGPGASGTLTMMPFPVGTPLTISAMGAWVGSTGTGVVRMGLYNADATTGLPSTKLFDGGTVTAATTAVLHTVASSHTISTGLYWIACLADSAPNGSWRVFTGINRAMLGWDNTATGNPYLCLTASGVATGSLPTTAPAMTPTITQPLRIMCVAA